MPEGLQKRQDLKHLKSHNEKSDMKDRAPRNKTLSITTEDLSHYTNHLLKVSDISESALCDDGIINADIFTAAKNLPRGFVDLLILDPPYNLSKNYHGEIFKEKTPEDYYQWFETLINILMPTLKSTASIYVCADWKTSALITPILVNKFTVRNRITWEREKGRGATSNWKNNTEDIWFCTVSEDYYFDADAVKMKKKVIAPYKINGQPKDWTEEENGNYRLTHPSNIWTDITIPFWSMPENTDHPTQKPEKLMAKIILASSKKQDFIFDPFLGSGTTAVVAKKLGRRFLGVEKNITYCAWALKRLEIADVDNVIQGYANGVFWERNSLSEQNKIKQKSNPTKQASLL